MQEQLDNIFPVAGALLAKLGASLVACVPRSSKAGDVPGQFRLLAAQSVIPGYLPDLARIELVRYQLVMDHPQPPPTHARDHITLNPTLQLLEVDWQPLLPLLAGVEVTPRVARNILLFWQQPGTGELQQAEATSLDLLALKVVAEQLEPIEIAATTGQPVGVVDSAIDRAVDKGLLLAPASQLRRNVVEQTITPEAFAEYVATDVFTLQWHITHRCDLHCRHCYDRSKRREVSLAKGQQILDQMRRFCRNHHVRGQVSFTGGNPFLHPDFAELYQAAHDRNLAPAILGNPVEETELDSILRITKPGYFQVSLEGLETHNDQIRGKGSYRAVLEFLGLLKRKRIYSMVMLTLTRANLDQVLPLAEVLRDRVDLFTFNRLAMVGEGAQLAAPQPEEYHEFVKAYLDARRTNPILALKDNLINIELEQRQVNLFGGCTGFGCGAAFNFVSLLPDGKVHACRKFPSPIGDLNHRTLSEIYHSAAARAYRQGCHECAECHLRLVCGGCLAVSHGWGLEPLQVKDPDCFRQ